MKSLTIFIAVINTSNIIFNFELFVFIYLFAGYGHLDVFIGKNAHRDVWPKLVSVFDKYAQDDVARDKGVRVRVQSALNRVKLVSMQGKSKFSWLLDCH